jgi:hypothetical protein
MQLVSTILIAAMTAVAGLLIPASAATIIAQSLQ